jgi:predicted helicase
MIKQNDASRAIKKYLKFMQTHLCGGEVQYRTELHNLLKSIEFPSKNIEIIQEDVQSGVKVEGKPDFYAYEITVRSPQPQAPLDKSKRLKKLIGFIECKKPACNLESLIKSDQIKKYQRACQNIILTNYNEFILLQKGQESNRVILAADELAIQKFTNLLLKFYNYSYPYIKTKNALVTSLANQSFCYSASLCEFMNLKTNEKDSFYIKFNALFEEYQKSINYHYELADFCDIYAQSLVYGLMIARLDSDGKILFDEQNLDYLQGIPSEYKLLYEFLDKGYERHNPTLSIKLATIGIGKNLNLIDAQSIKSEFETMRDGKQSLALYLYENFLQEYDNLKNAQQRKQSGVYYTPMEAANFITRSVGDIIKLKFLLKDGYLSDNVKVLDFACGTGTFLHSIFNIMLHECTDDLSKQKAKDKIIKDIYGFEILFTPYTVAHTLLTKYLKDNGIILSDNERLGICLTNTLDIGQHAISELLPALKQESDMSTDIKNEQDILAIVGNPPYSASKSQSAKGAIDGLLGDYKKGLNEKNHRLEDIYIKFIRFAQWKIEKAGHGVVGVITNNSYLDGLTHRKMRECLYNAFDEIYILNLHGNSRRKEQDKNIFNIMAGVCVTFFIKYKSNPQKTTLKSSASSDFARTHADDPLQCGKKTYYFSTLANNLKTRNEKLNFLKSANLANIKWQELKPQETEDYWFVNKNWRHASEYKKFYKITDIFDKYNSGIKTHNDDFVFKYLKTDIDNLKDEASRKEIHEIAKDYNVKDGPSWKIKTAIKDLINNYNPKEIAYRIWDNRWTSYSLKANLFLVCPRRDWLLGSNYPSIGDGCNNIGLCFMRGVKVGDNFGHVFISKYLTDAHLCGPQLYLAPLYLYNEDKTCKSNDKQGNLGLNNDDNKTSNPKTENNKVTAKTPNFTDKFTKEYLNTLTFKPSPQEILQYIYAVLHSPVYRTKYIEFLKTDFPAVSLTKDKDAFYRYSCLGKKLINLHLLQDLPQDKSVKCDLGGVIDGFVLQKITFIDIDDKLTLTTTNNDIITIENTTSQIYNFEIGSYKPIVKWLKYRIKDKVNLNYKDIAHIKDMVIAIKNTIAVMEELADLGEDYLK